MAESFPVQMVPSYLALLSDRDQALVNSPDFDTIAMRSLEALIGTVKASQSLDAETVARAVANGFTSQLQQLVVDSSGGSDAVYHAALECFLSSSATSNLTVQDFPRFLRFLIAYRIHCYFETSCLTGTSTSRPSSQRVPDRSVVAPDAEKGSPPTIVFIIGGPGSGKRTFGDLIAKTFGHIHLPAGNLLRQAARSDNSEIGSSLRAAMDECKVVPSDLTVSLIVRAMKERGWFGQKFVISGFPRSLANLEAWDKSMQNSGVLKFFMNLECSEGKMEARMASRGDADYSVDKIRQRFVTFYHDSLPVLDECRRRGKLRRIDSEKDKEVVWKEIQRQFGPSVIFVLGAPSSGKSTQCMRIVNEFGYRHICLTDIIREEHDRAGSVHRDVISKFFRTGALIPSSLIVELVRQAMERQAWDGGKFLLEGFPRSAADFAAWQDDVGPRVTMKFCLFFECSDSVIKARCLKGGSSKSSSVECDQAAEKWRSSFSVDLLPMIEGLESEGALVSVNGEPDADDIWNQVQQYFKPSVVLVLSGPGTGTKELCRRLSEKHGYHHLSASECLQAERSRPGSDHGSLIEKHMRDGTLVPSKITVSVIGNAMKACGWEHGKYLIHGFPLSLEGLEDWKREMQREVSLKCCLFFECTEETIEESLQAGSIESKDIEVLRKRWQNFQRDAMPVVKQFELDGMLRKVDTRQDQDHVLLCAQEVLKWEVAFKVRNHALVLIKPHAAYPAATRFVQSHFATHNVSVLKAGSAPLTNFDLQYSQLLRFATTDPKQLAVSSAGQEIFRTTFGMSWQQALADNKVLGGVSALSIGMSPRELMEMCGSGVIAKLAPSLQIARISPRGADAVFVVNGFFPYFKDTFGNGKEQIDWLVVEFKTKDMSWERFRREILGATDPAQAHESSIRGQLWQHWAKLGLKAQPDVLNNCVHASAGPLEGLRERILWTGVSVYDDPLGRWLLASGISKESIDAWFENVDVSGWKRGTLRLSGPVFDCSEGCNTRDFRNSAVGHVRSSANTPLVYWPVKAVASKSGNVLQTAVTSAPHHQSQYQMKRQVSGESLKSETRPGTITLLHFNDVYNVEPRKKEPVGGVARFVTRVRELKQEAVKRGEPEAVCIFSGDAFNPSLTSTITKGKHMVQALNAIGIDIAVFGNHDFDHGVDNLLQMKDDTNFPWLISNANDKYTGLPLAGGEITYMLNVQGRKLGVIGLIEYEWLTTLHTLEPEDVDYEDFCPCARRLGKQLRKEGADVVIAITHMRMPNDFLLAHEVQEIDIILGGHDHHYEVKQVGPHGTYVLNSGTDFRDLSAITLRFNDAKAGGGRSCEVTATEHVEINASIIEDAETKVFVDECIGLVSAGMDMVIGQSAVDLDCRFSMIRTQETNIGNFVADIMRTNMKADIALLNSGTLRADAIISAGPFTMRDLVSLLPMLDELCLLQLSGEQVRNVLENSVCMYPRLEGRFAQVSGVTFTFDASKPGGQRIVEGSIKIGNEALDLERNYKVTNLNFLRQGKDGYGALKEAVCLADGEQSGILPTMVKDYFNDVSMLNGYESVTDRTVVSRAGTMKQDGNLTKIGEGPEAMQILAITPAIEGRIVCLNPVAVA